MTCSKVVIIGGGLAGTEAAFQLAESGIAVTLIDGKPDKSTAAHKTPYLAELVCSNSFKAMRRESAAGLLKHELKALNSHLLQIAKDYTVPAGGALAVDDVAFAKSVTLSIKNHPLIDYRSAWLDTIPEPCENQYVIIATGPLTGEVLSHKLSDLIGDSFLKFFDAVAPTVLTDTLNHEACFLASRYGRGEPDYWNCPMDQATYEAFWSELCSAQTAPIADFEKHLVFEGCMPLEVMANRGKETLRFGPLKPVGLTDPKTGRRPYACLQLRYANKEGTLAHLVGCQTRLSHNEQLRVFRMIPALKEVQFANLGVMHRNTYVSAPKVLNADLSLKNRNDIYIAGQLNGMEGYVAAIASGWYVAQSIIAKIKGYDAAKWLPQMPTMLGAMVEHLLTQSPDNCQPFAASFGLLPEPMHEAGKKIKKTLKRECQLELADKALEALLANRLAEERKMNEL